MNHIASSPEPLRPAPVEPDLLASAIFIAGEYVERLQREAEALAGEDEEDAGPKVEMRDVLDLFVEELGTDPRTAIHLYLRVAALSRLLSIHPALARMARAEPEADSALTETALVAAARLDLHIRRRGAEQFADFDVREFRAALGRNDL
jgi:hypothetical protein